MHGRLTLALSLVVAIVLGSAGSLQAQEPTPKTAAEPSKQPEKASTKAADKGLSHRYQFGVGVRAGTGYRVIAPYNSQFCGDKSSSGEAKSVCGSRQPFWLELSPSFGFTQRLELLVDVRLYLEADYTKSKGFFVAPGIKYYTDPDDILKFFATGQVVFESQDMGDATVANFDIGIRSALGLQFDILRYLGFYIQGGVVLGLKRWMTFNVDIGAGLQARY